MLEISYRKLGTLIEGTLGDTVKIEDLSLKPLTFAERSWRLLNGFFRSRSSTTWLTSQYEGLCQRLSTTLVKVCWKFSDDALYIRDTSINLYMWRD
jgi:hypothetical protein